MAERHVEKRTLPSGKVRWVAIWGATKKARRSKAFATKGAALAFLDDMPKQAPSGTAPLRQLVADYKAHYAVLVGQGVREQGTLAEIEQHLKKHVETDADFIALRCADATTPNCQLFLNRLLARASHKRAVKIRGTLSGLFGFGARAGYVPVNPISATKLVRTKRRGAGQKAPFTLPAKEDLRALIEAAHARQDRGKAEAIIRLFTFCGLRGSELRGLPRTACKLVGEAPLLSVTQRADRYCTIGAPKSAAGGRDLDLGPETAQAVRVWLVAAPVGSTLVFPSEEGTPLTQSSLYNRFWIPLLNEAGLVTSEPASKVVRTYRAEWADYKQPRFYPHMLRHVYASLQIENGVSPKRLQKLMGHATLKLTMDTYGHLWPDEDADRARARGVERAL